MRTTIIAGAAIAVGIILTGCSGENPEPDRTGTALVDKMFDDEIRNQNLDVDPTTARREAHNVCADMEGIAPDPDNIDPFELYALAQKVSIRTDLSTEDAATLMGVSMAAYCPEYKQGFNK